MLRQQDPEEFKAGLVAIGPWFALSCSAHFLALCLGSVTLRGCAGIPGLGLGLFLRASITGHAVNQTTPLTRLGEVTKYGTLVEKLHSERAIAALVAQNLVMFVANSCLFVLAPLVAFMTIEIESRAAVVLLGISMVVFSMLAAWFEQIEPVLSRFRPDLIFLSAGFDADPRDPLTNLRVTPSGFGELTSAIVSAANQHCEGRIISVLEGGYNLEALGDGVEVHVRALLM